MTERGPIELVEKLRQLNDSQTRENQWGKAAAASSYAAYVSGLLPAIIAALEDCERLRKAMKLLLDASDILLTVTNEHGDEELTIDDWLRFGASRNAVRAALEDRDG